MVGVNFRNFNFLHYNGHYGYQSQWVDLTKKLKKKKTFSHILVSAINSRLTEKSNYSQYTGGKMKNLLSSERKKFRQNNFISKNVVFTKFLPKVSVNCRNFQTVL